ncbi:hypothetical protein AMS68_003029 [Peltaster fructicola]|uniref:Uncharacterized protein n=1 Tax=Peltaster fructicola TaxID=286661 RepID=A0A6H0XRX3_9PEZI|nr:hypothetical protein AMS68_003029 [Peltaster fructicola]
MATRDVLVDAVYNEVAAYRYRDFATSLMIDVAVVPDTEARIITFGHSRRLGYTTYQIKPWSGASKTLSIVCNRSRKPVISESTRKELHAHLDGFDRLANPIDDIDTFRELRQVRAWEALQRWWLGNGKYFHFLDLPPELRVAMYSFAVPSRVHPVPYRGHGVRRRRCIDGLPIERPLSLFTVSRQISNEALGHSYLYTTRIVEDASILKELTTSACFLSNVRRLELAINMDLRTEFFLFRDTWAIDHSEMASLLPCSPFRAMALAHITVRIPQGRHRTVISVCDTTFTTACLAMVLHHFGGQRQVEVLGVSDQGQAIAFKHACRRARSAYELWRTNAEDLGHDKLGLEHYDEWIKFFSEDEHGGVSVAKGNNVDGDTIDTDWIRRCDRNGRCICVPLHAMDRQL